MKSKLLASMLIVIAFVCVLAFSTSAATVTISTPEEFLTLMNEGYTMSDTFELAGDIDLSATTGQTPIGTAAKKFTGTFDGKGYTVSGINITSSTDTTYPYVGLFGLCQKATIKNVTVEGAVTAPSNDSKDVYAGGLVAWTRGITIDNCHSYITVVNNDAGACAGGIIGYADYNGTNVSVVITDTTNHGDVTAAQYTGGILGLVQSVNKANQILTITGCKNYGDITITAGNCVGGIVGYYRCGSTDTTGSEFTLSDCANYGTVENTATASSKGGYTGGIIGAVLASGSNGTYDASITLTNLYNAGSVKRAISASIGAVVGYLTLPVIENGTVDVTMSDWVNVSTSPSWLIYSIGTAGSPVALTMTNMVNNTSTRVFSTENDLSQDVTINTNNTVTVDGYVTSASTEAEKKAFVEANASDYYIDNGNVALLSQLTLDTEIGSAEELELLMATPAAWGDNYTLVCDIDISGITQSPIGTARATAFTGSFDGKNHTISGLNISYGAQGGALFGWTHDASITDLTVEGTVKSSNSRAGGLVGCAVGDLTVSGCTIDVDVTATAGASAGVLGTVDCGTEKGTVTITDTTSAGNVSGKYYMGGIIGYVLGANDTAITVSGCANLGNVEATSADSTYGSASGGIIGYIIPSNAVTYTVENSENSGKVTGLKYVGGIIGVVGSPTAGTRNDINIVVSGTTNSGDIETTSGNVVGGILGYYYNTTSTGTNTIEITGCQNTGAITSNGGSGTCAGGVVGAIGGTGSNTCNLASVTISNISSTGVVSGAAASSGSIAGVLRPANGTEYKISDVYAENNVYVIGATGSNATDIASSTFDFARVYNFDGTRLIGNNAAGAASVTQADCYHKDTMGQTSITHYYEMTAESSAWVMTYDGPRLASFLGDSVEVDYSIDSADDLVNLMNAPYAWGGGTFTLTKSISLSGKEQSPIGIGGNFKFMADFDGKGYTISGLNIDYAEQGAGLFGTVQYGSIKNVTVKGTVNGQDSRVGGLVGAVRAPFTIENVTTEVNVTATNGATGGIVGIYIGFEDKTLTITGCTSNSTVNGKAYNGGIVGYVLAGAAQPQNLVITDCTNNGAVTGSSQGNGGILGTVIVADGSTVSITGCKNTGAVQGTAYTGGIFGYTVDNADFGASTNVTYTIDDCENTGTITSTSGSGTGGIAGLLTLFSGSDITVSNCINRGAVSGPQYNGGIVSYISNTSDDEVNGASYTITGCENYGSVETTTGNVAGGILGFYNNVAAGTENNTLVVEKSANYGDITVGGGNYGGGVIGCIGGSTNGSCRLDVTLSELYNASENIAATNYRGGIVGALRILAEGSSYTIRDLCSEGVAYALIGALGTGTEEFTITRAHNIDGAQIVGDNGGNTVTGVSALTPSSPASYLVRLAENSKWVMTLEGAKLKLFTDEADVIDTSKSYTINTADDLVTVMNHSAIWSLDFVLAKSIDLSGKTQTPIGTSERKFTGTFDGQNKTISGIDITHGQNAGLFGVAQGSAQDHCIIKNLTVDGTVEGTNSRVGGIVAAVAGGGVEVLNCTSNVDISAAAGAAGGIIGTIQLSDYGENIELTTLVESCTNNGTVTGSRYNGGIVGYLVGNMAGSDVTVTKCTNNGDVVNTSLNCAGGILGYYHLEGEAGDPSTTDTSYLTITHCGNYGDVTAPETAQFIGGIIGAIPSHLTATYKVDVVISNVYNAGTITGRAGNTGSITGLVNTLAGGSYTFDNWGDEGANNIPMLGDIGVAVEGFNSAYALTNAYTANGTVITTALDGNTVDTTLTLNAASSPSDKAALAAEEGWVMTKDGPMLLEFTTSDDFEVDLSIDSVEDYLILINAPDAWSKDITLECDLDLGNAVTKPIGNSDTAFTGTFDGKGFTISGLNVKGTEVGTGFFGVVSDDGDKTVIKNFTIEGAVSCDTYRFVGGFVGIVCGEAELDGLVNKATVTSDYFGANAGRIGGIVGGFVNNNLVPEINDVDNDGDFGLTIKNCENYGKVEGKLNTAYEYSDEYNTTPTVFVRHSQARVGGIIGSITPAYETATNKGSNTILIESCKNYGEVTGIVAVGGIAGVAESSKSTNSIKITKCSNYGEVSSVYAGGADIWFGTWTGGIVGYANLGSFDAKYVDSFEISYCYNEGEVFAPNAYLIDSRLAQEFIDEDDVVTDGEGVEDGSGDDTATTSAIEYRAQIGGIVGYAYGGYGDYVVTVKSCFNNGLVWANGNDVAGIIGIANSAHVYDCYNTGRVESTFIDTKSETRSYGRYVGGIIGRIAGSLNDFERNFNKGEVVSTGGKGMFGVGGGYNAYPTYYANNFYCCDNVATDKNSTKVTAAQLSDYSVFTGINESDEWLYTLYGPELVYFHECANTEKVIIVEGSCINKEVYDEACRCLETVYNAGVVGELNPDNHAFDESVWAETDVAGTYEFKCKDCQVVKATDTTPFVYVDAYNFISDFVGDDENDGVTPETAVYSIEEAVRRLANTGGKVIICDRYYLGKNGVTEINLPAYEKTITITTKLSAEGKVITGFAVVLNGVHFNLGGPTKFENILFNGTSDVKNSSDGGYYKIPVICAGWNDLEFGEGIAAYGMAYVVAGNCYHDSFKVASALNDAEKTQNLVFSKVTAYNIADGSGATIQNAVTFFGRVYLGDRVRSGAVDEVSSYTVANKTVNASFNRTTVLDLYAASAISPEDIDAQMQNVNTTINLNEDAYVKYLHTGDGNTDGNGNGTAYMDKLTVNVNDKARIYGAWSMENIRDLTVNISANEDGRTDDYGLAARLFVTASKGYTATGSEKVALTYGTHSFLKSVAAPAFNAVYNGKTTITVKDDCDWGEPVLDVVAGIYTQTCSYCGAIKTTLAEEAAQIEEGKYRYGMSAILANELLPEYLVQVSNELVVTDAYLKVEHFVEGSDEPIVEVVECYKAVAGDAATTYRFYAPGVAAKEMNDTIQITFYALVNGERYVAPAVQKNIVDYYKMAYKAYGSETRGQAPALMATLYSLLNYGAEAQRYFEYNTDALVNAVLPEDKKVTDFTAEATAEVEVVSDCANDVYTISGFTPILEDRVVLALSYTLEGEPLDAITFKGSYKDINGIDKTFEASGSNVVITVNSVVVYVDVVAAKDLRQMITGALYNGDTQISDSVTFSFECYATIAEAAEENICAAILNYCDAAKALFYKEATVTE